VTTETLLVLGIDYATGREVLDDSGTQFLLGYHQDGGLQIGEEYGERAYPKVGALPHIAAPEGYVAPPRSESRLIFGQISETLNSCERLLRESLQERLQQQGIVFAFELRALANNCFRWFKKHRDPLEDFYVSRIMAKVWYDLASELKAKV
jgi:hypothetical protein